MSQCRCWGLDEGDVVALCHSHRLVSIFMVCFAVEAVPTEYPFCRSCLRVWVAAAALLRHDYISQVRPSLHVLPNACCRPCRRFFLKSYRSLLSQERVWSLEWFVVQQIVFQTQVKFTIKVVPGCSTIHQHGQGCRGKSACVRTSLPSLGSLRSFPNLC